MSCRIAATTHTLHQQSPPEDSANAASHDSPADDSDTRDASYAGKHHKLFWWLRFCGVTITIGVLVYLYLNGNLTQENLQHFSQSLPAWLFLIVWMSLPLVGFPISVTLLASGLKFGVGISIVLTTAVMAFHTYAAWKLTHGVLRPRVEQALVRTRYSLPAIPDRHQIWFTCVFVTVPGLPYAVKLYALALTNLSFVRYMVLVWGCHVLNAVPFILLGAAAGHFNSTLLIAFAVLAVCSIVFTKWMQKSVLNKPS